MSGLLPEVNIHRDDGHARKVPEVVGRKYLLVRARLLGQVDFMQVLTYQPANMPGWCIAGLKASA